jgi:S1-C subfamily serine protease
MSLLLLAGCALARTTEPSAIVLLGRVTSGSGFFVSPDGDLITSAHVVAGCPSVSVWAADGARRTSFVVGTNDALDIALLRAPGSATAFARAPYSSESAVGATVFALGYGVSARDPRRAVSAEGVYLGAAIIPSGARVSVISAQLQHGQSGGPVIDADGALFGMVIGRYTEASNRGVVLPVPEIETFLSEHGIQLAAGSVVHDPSPRQFLKAIAVLVQCEPAADGQKKPGGRPAAP